MVAKALSVAGFDPSGGAGVLADVRTFNSYGVYGAAVITAITFQDTARVYGVSPLPPEQVGNQLEGILSDMDFGAVKTGMLATAAVVDVVAQAFASQRVRNLVVDPVIRSSSGAELLDGEGIERMVKKLFPMATLITPNVPEAETLTGVSIRGVEDMKVAASRLLDMGPEAVLIKGGHLRGEVVDVLMVRKSDGTRAYVFVGDRLDVDIHGTGCVLASSIASLLALGCDLITSVSMAVSDMRKLLREGAFKVGKGRKVLFRTRWMGTPC